MNGNVSVVYFPETRRNIWGIIDYCYIFVPDKNRNYDKTIFKPDFPYAFCVRRTCPAVPVSVE